MPKQTPQRWIAISGIIILITAGNYLRLSGIHYVHPIHIVTLLTCGAAIGIFISNIILFFKNKKENN